MFQHGNNLIIGLILIQHSESSDRANFRNNIPVRNRFLSQDTNIKRVTIPVNIRSLGLQHTIFGNQVATIGLRQKTI